MNEQISMCMIYMEFGNVLGRQYLIQKMPKQLVRNGCKSLLYVDGKHHLATGKNPCVIFCFATILHLGIQTALTFNEKEFY